MTPHQLSLLNPARLSRRAEVPNGPDLNRGGTGACRPACSVAVPGFRVPGLLGQAPGYLLWLAVRLQRHADPQTEDLPPFLLDLRERAAVFAGLAPSDLQQVLLTEYAPGAGIGWHKDKPMFAEVVGLSLLSRCVFRLRRKTGATWERSSSYSSHARPTCFRVLPEPTGSTASRPWTACATRSRSGPSGLDRLPRDPIGPRLLRSSLEARLQLEVIEAVDRANLDVVHRAITREVHGHDNARGTQSPDLAVEARPSLQGARRPPPR